MLMRSLLVIEFKVSCQNLLIVAKETQICSELCSVSWDVGLVHVFFFLRSCFRRRGQKTRALRWVCIVYRWSSFWSSHENKVSSVFYIYTSHDFCLPWMCLDDLCRSVLMFHLALFLIPGWTLQGHHTPGTNSSLSVLNIGTWLLTRNLPSRYTNRCSLCFLCFFFFCLSKNLYFY